VNARWPRVLLAVLGVCDLVMAANATPVQALTGAACGTVLVAVAALVGRVPRGVGAGLVVLGAVPFAVVAWTALAPVIVMVLALALAPAALGARAAATGRP
jgi:hypothetical protein